MCVWGVGGDVNSEQIRSISHIYMRLHPVPAALYIFGVVQQYPTFERRCTYSLFSFKFTFSLISLTLVLFISCIKVLLAQSNQPALNW